MNQKYISILAVLIAIIFAFYMIFGSFYRRGHFKDKDFENLESETVSSYKFDMPRVWYSC